MKIIKFEIYENNFSKKWNDFFKIWRKICNFQIKKKLIVENLILTVFFHKCLFRFFFMIFKFIFRFFLFFNYVDCHVAKVAQSSTVTFQTPCHISKNVESRTFFKQKKFYTDFFKKKIYKNKNQNWPKLQGRKSYLNFL